MKNNQHVYKEEVDRLVQEKLEEWHQKHIAKIETKYSNTYISYGICDDIAYKGMYVLQKLFELMGLEYSVYVPFGEALRISSNLSRSIKYVLGSISQKTISAPQ